MANKLELTWVGKDEEIKVEPRVLIENPELSNISHKAVGQASIFDTEKLVALIICLFMVTIFLH